MFCYYLLGPSPRDTFFPALPIYLHVSLSSPYQTNNPGSRSDGHRALAGLFHRCAFHLQLIHSAYSVHQCTRKVLDYIFCLRLVYLASIDELHYCRQTDTSVDTHQSESQQVGHVYANTICMQDAIKQESWPMHFK